MAHCDTEHLHECYPIVACLLQKHVGFRGLGRGAPKNQKTKDKRGRNGSADEGSTQGRAINPPSFTWPCPALASPVLLASGLPITYLRLVLQS